MSRGPIRHREDLDVLPKEGSFVFQDHLPGVAGGLVRYWKDRGHPIEEVKRTPPEEFQNFEGARLDLSGEFTAIRSVKLGGALDGCGLSVGPEREPSKRSPEDERMHRWVGKLVVTVSEIDRITRELGAIQTAIGVLKQREQDLLEKRDKLMEAA